MDHYHFTQEEMGVLRQVGTQHCYRPNEPICFEGDAANDLYVIRRGRVRVMCHVPSGEEITLGIVEEGRIFGESSFLTHSAYPASVFAVNEVELICCSIDLLLDCLGTNREISRKLLQQCSISMNHLSYLIHDMCFLDRYGRVASFLLRETEIANPAKNIAVDCLPYTHEEIGWCIGLDRATVTRVLGDFRKRGLVEAQYRKIIVKNRAGLREVALRGRAQQPL